MQTPPMTEKTQRKWINADYNYFSLISVIIRTEVIFVRFGYVLYIRYIESDVEKIDGTLLNKSQIIKISKQHPFEMVFSCIWQNVYFFISIKIYIFPANLPHDEDFISTYFNQTTNNIVLQLMFLHCTFVSLFSSNYFHVFLILFILFSFFKGHLFIQ